MNHFTVKIVFDISADDLYMHLQRHVAMHQTRAAGAETFDVAVFAGRCCAALMPRHKACPDRFLHPIGPPLAALWMDVRHQDGDSWDLSCYTGFQHELRHSVNPWAYEPEFVYDTQAARAVEYRINKLCKLLPDFADEIRPYLLLCRHSEDPTQPKRLVARQGKARPTDQFEYGDAYQFYDLLSCFRIDLEKPVHTATARL